MIKIDLNSISLNPDFNVKERDHSVAGKVFLINPSLNKHRWTKDEAHLRSLLVREDGTIICSGFPKFKNYGEDSEDDALIEDAIQNQTAYITEKMDGSLLIRTVINGEVCFRTRGCHNIADEMNDDIMQLINEKYPALLNKDYYSTSTVLMEYVSPKNQIVLQYAEPQLYALGIMTYEDHLPRFASNSYVIDQLHFIFGLEKVKIEKANTINMIDIISQVRGRLDSEGIVIWGYLSNDSKHPNIMIKVKAEEYLRIHALKFNLSNSAINYILYKNKITTDVGMHNYFSNLGLDWETITVVNERFSAFKERMDFVTCKRIEITNLIQENSVYSMSRGDAARYFASLYQDKTLFNIAINIYLSNAEKVDKLIWAYSLDVSIMLLNMIDSNQYVNEKFE
jgi:hypothetical protein